MGFNCTTEQGNWRHWIGFDLAPLDEVPLMESNGATIHGPLAPLCGVHWRHWMELTGAAGFSPLVLLDMVSWCTGLGHWCHHGWIHWIGSTGFSPLLPLDGFR